MKKGIFLIPALTLLIAGCVPAKQANYSKPLQQLSVAVNQLSSSVDSLENRVATLETSVTEATNNISDLPKDWQTYTNSNLGFSISYPADWKAEVQDLEKLKFYTKYTNAELILRLQPTEDTPAQVEPGLFSQGHLIITVFSNDQGLTPTAFMQKWNDTGAQVIQTRNINDHAITYLNLGGMTGSVAAVWLMDSKIFDLEDVLASFQGEEFEQILSTFRTL